MMTLTQCASSSFAGTALARSSSRSTVSGRRTTVRVNAAADRPMWVPGAIPPDHLDGSLAGDFGFDPMCLGSNPEALKWYQQAELQHARWAMVGVAGILGAEIVHPDIAWYDAPLQVDLPINLAALLAIEFFLMHYVEVRRFMDIRKPGSVNEDPIFKGNKIPDGELGYPGGIFNPFNYGADDMETMKLKEIKNGRLAMISFVGFVIQYQTVGLGPLASLKTHISLPFGQNIVSNIGKCILPESVDAYGVTVATPCLWPYHG